MPAMPKTDRNAISQDNIISKHSVAANHNVEGVLDQKTTPYTRLTRKLD